MLAQAIAFKSTSVFYNRVELTGDDISVAAVGFADARARIITAVQCELVLDKPNRFGSYTWDECYPEDAEGVTRLIHNMFYAVTKDNIPEDVQDVILRETTTLLEAEYYYREGDNTVFMYSDGRARHIWQFDYCNYKAYTQRVQNQPAATTVREAIDLITQAVEAANATFARADIDAPPIRVNARSLFLQIYGTPVSVDAILQGRFNHTIAPSRLSNREEIELCQRAVATKQRKEIAELAAQLLPH